MITSEEVLIEQSDWLVGLSQGDGPIVNWPLWAVPFPKKETLDFRRISWPWAYKGDNKQHSSIERIYVPSLASLNDSRLHVSWNKPSSP